MTRAYDLTRVLPHESLKICAQLGVHAQEHELCGYTPFGFRSPLPTMGYYGLFEGADPSIAMTLFHSSFSFASLLIVTADVPRFVGIASEKIGWSTHGHCY